MAIQRKGSTDCSVASCATALLDVLPNLVRVLRHAAYSGARAERLTPAQYRLLACLAKGEQLSGDLARALGVTPSSITTTVKILVARGLVERSESPADRRCVHVRLTPAGRRLWEHAWQRLLASTKDLVAQLSASEREHLAAGLVALCAVLPTSEAPAVPLAGPAPRRASRPISGACTDGG